MGATVTLPVWLVILIVAFALWAALDRVLLPSVRWYFRKRLTRAVDRLNTRLARPIEPFKLTRRADMVQRLIYDSQVLDAVTETAAEEDIPESVAFQRAQRYAREIVPSFSATAYFGFGIRAARRLAEAIYHVRTAADPKLAKVPPDATVIFVMNHRSNMDYVLVTYLAARASALSYAVGEWARHWPLSAMIRSMGAYFIRRKSRGMLYRRVLARYVALATAGGVTQAVFPEGGLSLTGRLAPPKLGLLAYIVAGAREAGREVVFVPVALSYDRVLEDRVLIAAGQSGERRFPARMGVVARFILRRLWQKVRGQFQRFGMAAVYFGAPVSLGEFGPEAEVEEIGAALMARIGQVMPILPVPLLAQLFLEASDPLDLAAVERGFADRFSERAGDAQRALLTPQTLPDGLVLQTLELMVKRGLLEKSEAGYQASSADRDVLTYYAAALASVLSETVKT